METEKKEKIKKAETPEKKKTADEEKSFKQLSERCWSVVNFEACLASGLTYDEAAEEMKKHARKNVSGLCIVTDNAAGRVGKKQ